MNLTIIALDLKTQEDFALVVDQFHDAELTENCLIVDLGSRNDWKGAWPDELPVALPECLARKMWSRIVVVSVRGRLDRDSPTPDRVHAEHELLDFLKSSYGANREILGVTLSEFGSVIHESQFPLDYVANFLHEPRVEIDPDLPLTPITAATRNQVLVFTAFSIANTGRWATGDVLANCQTQAIGPNRVVRFVRVLSRIAMCPPIVGNMVRTAVRPGGGAIPAGAGVVVPMDNQPDLVRKVADQFAHKYSLVSRPFGISRTQPEKVPAWVAFKDLLAQLPMYLRAAARAEWRARISEVTDPIKRRLGDIAFGAGSSFVVDGVDYGSTPDAMNRLAEELKARLEGLDGVVSPIATPDVWSGLLQTSFAFLDAGDFPPGVEPPHSGGRVIFMNPNVVGPNLEIDSFSLTSADCEMLELPTEMARSVGVFDTTEVDELGEQIRAAVSKARFRKDVVERRKADEEAKRAAQEAEEESKSRLRGTLSRAERISAKRDSTIDSGSIVEQVGRLPDQIEEDFTRWDIARRSISRDSFIALLHEKLNASVDAEFEKMQWEELLKEAEALLTVPEKKSLKLRKIVRIFLGLLAVLLVVGFLVSNVFSLVLSILGIPVMLFVAIGWMISFGAALAKSVLGRALEMRRWDLRGRSQSSEFVIRYQSLLHSINEFRRLQLLRMQFNDWQRLVRELAHNPYGKITDAVHEVIPIEDEDVPPQLVIAKVSVNSAKQVEFRNYVHQQLKTRGFLSSIASTMQNHWKEDYQLVSVGVSAQPELDITTPGLTPGVIYENRTYLFPRRDFVQQGIDGNLRSRMVAERVRALNGYFYDLPVQEILGNVDAGEARPAFREVTPLGYLKAVSTSRPRDFDSSMFSPQTGGHFFANNVDLMASFCSHDGAKVGDFLLHEDESGVLLGVTRVDVSKPIEPAQLVGYIAGEGPIDPEPKPDRQRPRI